MNLQVGAIGLNPRQEKFMRIGSFRSKGLAVLAVCALALTVFASDKNPVVRPVKIEADVVLSVSLDPVTFGEAVGAGKSKGSHVGKSVLRAAGALDFRTGDFVGEGVMITANGDLIYFKMRNLSRVEFNGGTGRFENATGGHTVELTAPPEQRMVDGKLIITFSYTGDGTITF